MSSVLNGISSLNVVLRSKPAESLAVPADFLSWVLSVKAPKCATDGGGGWGGGKETLYSSRKAFFFLNRHVIPQQRWLLKRWLISGRGGGTWVRSYESPLPSVWLSAALGTHLLPVQLSFGPSLPLSSPLLTPPPPPPLHDLYRGRFPLHRRTNREPIGGKIGGELIVLVDQTTKNKSCQSFYFFTSATFCRLTAHLPVSSLHFSFFLKVFPQQIQWPNPREALNIGDCLSLETGGE